MCSFTFSRKSWMKKIADIPLSILSSIVFTFLDFLDFILCKFYGFLDEFLEGKISPCYCCQTRATNVGGGEEGGIELSETLYRRRNVFREMGIFSGMSPKFEDSKKMGNGGGFGSNNTRWSDCGCESCVEWMSNVEQKLHFVVKEPSTEKIAEFNEMQRQDVIFVHGFLSSSSFWTETVFPHLSESKEHFSYRLFAVDLLGFGRSPKPRDCKYTLSDHLEMVEKSVISPYQMNSFHLVGHSMGCIVALALAAKYPNHVKSVTLIAPPYLLSSRGDASLNALNRLAEKTLWPPLLFGSSVMSWYEHVGRCVCFLVCRNHRTWERILKLLTFKSKLHFIVTDLTRHTHHSAWHTMHNVICGGAKEMDHYLETLRKSRTKLAVIQGSRDKVVPLECSNNIKTKVPDAEVSIIRNADHTSVILGREKDFARDLERIWTSVTDRNQ